MNRRDFLRFAAAAPAAACIPAAASKLETVYAPLSMAAIERAKAAMVAGYSMGPWFAFVHSEVERDIRDIAARDRWYYASKAWRADGKPAMSCREILAKYTPASCMDFSGRPEIGTVEGFRFITSERVA